MTTAVGEVAGAGAGSDRERLTLKYMGQYPPWAGTDRPSHIWLAVYELPEDEGGPVYCYVLGPPREQKGYALAKVIQNLDVLEWIPFAEMDEDPPREDAPPALGQ